MEVKAEGKHHRHIWTVMDKGSGNDSSMARTTGLVTIATVLTMCEHPQILSHGVHSPEQLPPEFLDRSLSMMVQSGVNIEHRIERAD
jgi:hypothetical protein